MLIETKVDELCKMLMLEKEQTADVDSLAKLLKTEPLVIEKIAKILQSKDIAELIYPPNVLAKPKVKLKKILKEVRRAEPEGKELASYEISSGEINAKVKILDLKGQAPLLYYILLPEIAPYTQLFLERIQEDLTRMVPIQAEEMSDVRRAAELLKKFHETAKKMLSEQFLETNEETLAVLSGILAHRMYGLGDMEVLMADSQLEEVGINGAAQPVSVFHRKYGWMKTNITLKNEDEIYNYAAQIGRKCGRDITVLSPILDAHLASGNRVCASLFPISTSGNTITLRKFATNPWTIIDFIDPKIHALSSEMAAFLWLCMHYEMNSLVVGGTASGKTSMLNSFCALIPPTSRTVTIEDTRELSLPKYLTWNWIPLVTRTPNVEGKGEVTMLELMISSLRMRPDRLIVGEVRERREAEVLVEAMHTGHAVSSTMHADTVSQAIRRLTEPPIELPIVELQSLHLVLAQYRDRRKGLRRTYEISELSAGSADVITTNSLYRWKARTDAFEKVNDSTRIFEELNLHTGMSVEEINEEIKARDGILKWMLERGIRDVDGVGALMNLYYKSPADVLKAAEKNYPAEKLFG